jgi:hypothetical protein
MAGRIGANTYCCQILVSHIIVHPNPHDFIFRQPERRPRDRSIETRGIPRNATDTRILGSHTQHIIRLERAVVRVKRSAHQRQGYKQAIELHDGGCCTSHQRGSLSIYQPISDPCSGMHVPQRHSASRGDRMRPFGDLTRADRHKLVANCSVAAIFPIA